MVRREKPPTIEMTPKDVKQYVNTSAAAELIQKSGAEVAGFSFLVELSFLEGQEKLKNYSSNINGIISY